MSNSEAETQKAADRSSVFVTTHWSVVLSAKDHNSFRSAEALETLCRTYWHPLFTFVKRRGYSPADAEDLTQAFFAWLLERNWLGRADQQRGRFRSFLLTSIGNFLANEWDKARTQKRGSGRIVSLQGHEAENGCALEPAEGLTPEQSFEWRWALTLLDNVLRRLREEYAASDREKLFEELKPTLTEASRAVRYAEIATRLGTSEGAVKVAVHRLRQRYRALLRAEIADTVASPGEVDDELRNLFSALAS